MLNEPCAWDLAEAAEALRAKRISSLEYATALLHQIDRTEPNIQAFALLDPARMLYDAAARDAEAAAGHWRGSLHGVPVGIKDNLATTAYETRAGSDLLAGNRPGRDAWAVSALTGAGAIVLGKMRMTAFAAMDPAATRNPWNLCHTPGGSSSGSAAAVAARMCPAALGSQTAGSIIRPAAYCGVCGLKPTYGVVERTGLVSCAWSMDHIGPIARTVRDLELVFGCFRPRRERDVHERHVIAVPDRYFFETLDRDMEAAFRAAVETFAGAGAEIRPISLPSGFETLAQAGIVVMYAEMAAYHRERFAAEGERYPSRLAVLVEQGLSITAADYLRAQQVRRRETQALSDVLEDVTALITPATPSAAPEGLEATGDWRFNLPFSASGNPCLTIPVGVAASGMPVGVQLVSSHFAEDALFRLGHVFQAETGWHRACPAVAAELADA